MMDDTTTKEILIRLETSLRYIEQGISGTHGRLDVLNGRTRQNELDIAAMTARMDGPPLKRSRASVVGALAGTATAAAYAAARYFLGK